MGGIDIPFCDAGYAAVIVAAASFMLNPHYHRMSDTIETFDLPFLVGVTNGLDWALSRI